MADSARISVRNYSCLKDNVELKEHYWDRSSFFFHFISWEMEIFKRERQILKRYRQDKDTAFSTLNDKENHPIQNIRIGRSNTKIRSLLPLWTHEQENHKNISSSHAKTAIFVINENAVLCLHAHSVVFIIKYALALCNWSRY